uniref:Ficolin 3 n=1 Tax=Rousettus aegyptiacus TaxID=9407 RepID=A0A7J8K8F0_ROUAE|nr:ficolin 3 [Rousettus aegyptiacus]
MGFLWTPFSLLLLLLREPACLRTQDHLSCPGDPANLLQCQEGSWELQVELEDFNGNCTFVHYGSFCLLGEADHYQLVLGKFSEGTAGPQDLSSWSPDFVLNSRFRERDL